MNGFIKKIKILCFFSDLFIYMNKERMREILKRLRDFILCCKKTVDVIEEVVEEVVDEINEKLKKKYLRIIYG